MNEGAEGVQGRGESPLTQAYRKISGDVHTHRAGTRVETNEAERERGKNKAERRQERKKDRQTENGMGC